MIRRRADTDRAATAASLMYGLADVAPASQIASLGRRTIVY